MSSGRDGELSTRSKGQQGESRAVEFLQAQGYRIVARNVRCRAGEIDLIAREGNVLVFVEVRTRARGTWGSALETVTAAKQARIAKVASFFLATQRPAFDSCRFDVMGITAGEITLIRDAFRLGL